MKLLLEGNSNEWYISNTLKLSLTDWESWKQSFLLVYSKKGWTNIRLAFNYKYMFGSLVEFIIKKERLLLEADKDIPELYRVYQIVCNLPLEIQDKLHRDKIKTIDDLIEAVKLFDNGYSGRKNLESKSEEEKKKLEARKGSVVKSYDAGRSPCPICRSMGFKNRYHPIQLCRNKVMQSKQQINLHDIVEDTEAELCRLEINDDETKNE